MRGRWVYVGSPSGPDGKGGAAQVLSVHAALLPVGTTGKIVYFSGSQWVPPENWEMIENKANFQLDPNYPTAKREIDHSRVYDCSTQQVSIIPSPDVDLFCSGHALLPNGHLLIAGGTQHFPPPDERAELHHAHWSGSRETWIFDPNLLEIRAAIRATVTALVPRENHIDLFATGTDGAVWSTFFEPDSVGWRGWFLIHPEVKMQPGATVTALVPRENHIDLFVTGTDGAVWSTFFEPDSVGWRGWFLIHPEVKMQPGATVTALVPRENHIDLFVTGTDGAVWSTFFEPDSVGWRGWFLIHPEVKMQPGATVTALVPRENHIDLFVTGTDGAVWSTFFEPDSVGWRGWFLIHPEVKMQPGATVTALVPRENHIDLFVTGTDGAVWSTFFEPDSVGWRGWFLIHPEVKMQPGATVTALVPRENHIDLFVTGTDGAVWSTFFEPDSVGWRGWFLIHPEVKMQPGATVTALVPRENHIDLFVTGTDGAVWSTFFEPDSVGWRGWFLLIIAGYPWIKGPLLNRDPGQTESGQPMGGGRWYPTLITLADGRVMAMCGHPLIAEFTTSSTNFDIRHNNTKPEVYDPRTNTWMLINKPLGADQTHNFAPYYPRLHIIPHTGEVFIVQPLYSSQIRDYVPQDPRCRPTKNGGDGLCSENPLDTNPPYTTSVKDNSLFYNVSTQDVTRAFPGPQTLEAIYLNPGFTSQETTSVLLPLLHEENYHPRVLICGGVQSLIADLSPDSTVPLQWKATAPRLLKTIRMYANSTLLPTGDVVVTGGVTKGIDPGNHYTAADGVKTVEIYRSPSRDNPDFWTLGPVAGETRGYHSVALLMPDGRVWTAGSEENANQFVPNLAIELLEPDYFQVPDRVVITDSPRSIVFGKSFTVRFHPTTTNTPISRVVLMRLGSATHAFDGDQRYVSIPFKQEGTTLTVECPSDSTIAPPGYYMLWLIDANNLPCKLAPFVRVAFSYTQRGLKLDFPKMSKTLAA